MAWEATDIAGRDGGLLRGGRRVVGCVEGKGGELECRGEQGALSAKLFSYEGPLKLGLLQLVQKLKERGKGVEY